MSASGALLRFYEGVRRGSQHLNEKQIWGLAGEVFEAVVSMHEDNPGPAQNWAAFKAYNRAVSEGRIPSAPPARIDKPEAYSTAVELFGVGLTEGINSLPASEPSIGALEARFGQMCDFVLMKTATEISPGQRQKLLGAIDQAAWDAGLKVKRFSIGDYNDRPEDNKYP
jgi:hypothetical protein